MKTPINLMFYLQWANLAGWFARHGGESFTLSNTIGFLILFGSFAVTVAVREKVNAALTGETR